MSRGVVNNMRLPSKTSVLVTIPRFAAVFYYDGAEVSHWSVESGGRFLLNVIFLLIIKN